MDFYPVIRVSNDQIPTIHCHTDDTVACPVALLQVACIDKKRQAEPTDLATLDSDVDEAHPGYPSKCRKRSSMVSRTLLYCDCTYAGSFGS